jgi:uncharacterized protein
MKYVVFYATGDYAKAPIHFEEHKAHWKTFLDDGTLLLIGPFGDPEKEGSMAVFATREAAQRFVDGDPFVTNGVVGEWTIREWNEVLA